MPLPQLISILESLDEFQELLTSLPGPATRLGIGGLTGRATL
jgi:hypothetical protein